MSDNPGLAALAVISVIADTFDVPQEKVSPSTHVDDIAGWELAWSFSAAGPPRKTAVSVDRGGKCGLC